MISENNPETSKKALIDKKEKIKSLKEKKRAKKNETKEVVKQKEIEEQENKDKEEKNELKKNDLDDLIKFDEQNNKDEILNNKIEKNNSNNSFSSNNNKNNEEKIINIDNINEEIIIDSNNNNNNINKEKEKEKEEMNINASEKKEDIKNNIKEEIKNIKEKKTKSKILIKKVKKDNKITSKTEPPSNNGKIQKRKDMNINISSNSKTIITKVERNQDKKIKKSVTIYTNNLNKRKFDSEKFNEYLKGINEYENRKKTKIENLRKQEEEKELKKIIGHPKINKESKLKFKVNQKKYSAIERLYTQDLMKRKEKQQILTKIYTPTFKPKICTNKNIISKLNQKNQNIRTEINEDEINFIIEDNENTNDEFTEEEKKKRNLSVKKRKKEKKEEEGENEIIFDNKKIENKLRSLLFKNKKTTNKRNKSVEKRRNIKFDLD